MRIVLDIESPTSMVTYLYKRVRKIINMLVNTQACGQCAMMTLWSSAKVKDTSYDGS